MQAVLLMVAKGAALAGSIGHAAAGAAGAIGSIAGGTGATSSALSALRIGTSAISALSTFGQANAQGAAMNAEARDELLASRQEYVKAQETANAINDRFNETVADQLAAASVGGISLDSGSVVQARRNAERDADRQLAISRNSANMNASLRKARAYTLQASARSTKEGGFLTGLAKIGDAFVGTRTQAA